jgi:hypothetical protein
MRSMAVPVSLAIMLFDGLGIHAAGPLSTDFADHDEAVLNAHGKIVKPRASRHDRVASLTADSQKNNIMRRQGSDSAVEITNAQRRHGTDSAEIRAKKIKMGTADPDASPVDYSMRTMRGTESGSGHHVGKGKWANWLKVNHLTAPAWAPHPNQPPAPTCATDLGPDNGKSDYGTVTHGCAACQKNCTEANKQAPMRMSWQIEPELKTCQVRDIKYYLNWTNIDQLGCSACGGKALKHNFEFLIHTNAGEGVEGYADKELFFGASMGGVVEGGPRGGGGDFPGNHTFEVWDTEMPSDDCSEGAAQPPGRWLAIPTGPREGDTYQCERFCGKEGGCCPGISTGMRCTANIIMGSGQVFEYRLRSMAPNSPATLSDDAAGVEYRGTEWVVTAIDLSQPSEVKVVGRVVLVGNSDQFGIKKIRQSHEHLGCTPCDLYYESTIVSGPFIMDPPDAHVIKKAMGEPPELTMESCELFRVSHLGGFAMKFESGPGLWSDAQVNSSIMTCDYSASSTCPSGYSHST